MKRLLPLLGISLLAIFFGCEKEENPVEPTQLAPPTNLTIEVAGADSLSLTLSWTASTDSVKGYIIGFKGETIDSTGADTLTYTHTPSSLGEYTVRAYKGNTKSEPISELTTLVEADDQGPVWWFAAPSDTGSSGYGWGEDGTGTCHNFRNENKPYIDFYMDTVEVVKGSDKMISPDAYPGWSDAHETWFYMHTASYDNIDRAPHPDSVNYYNYAEIALNGTYILELQSGNYLKMEVTHRKIEGHHNFVFKYGFQKIPGFRRLK
jgi:hypothetical protein